MSVKMDELFLGLQEKMIASLGINGFVGHPDDKGDISEEEWRKFFVKYLPKRYCVAKATVIDSEGDTSDQIDLVIYDNYYSPLVLEENGVTYIPVESVFAVFEVKQNLNRTYLQYAFDKFESVRKLKRTSVNINQMNETKAKKNVKPIFGGLLTQRCDWKEKPESMINRLFSERYSGDEENITFITCSLAQCTNVNKVCDKNIVNCSSDKSLLFMYKSILSELQVAGNPPAIDYNRYFRL